MNKNDGGPAFPTPGIDDGARGSGVYQKLEYDGGMTLRDYFAAKAMAAFLHPAHFAAMSELSRGMPHSERIAKEAYFTADAMLAARANEG